MYHLYPNGYINHIRVDVSIASAWMNQSHPSGCIDYIQVDVTITPKWIGLICILG